MATSLLHCCGPQFRRNLAGWPLLLGAGKDREERRGEERRGEERSGEERGGERRGEGGRRRERRVEGREEGREEGRGEERGEERRGSVLRPNVV